MGSHLSVMNLEGKEHPTWDWIRHAEDADFMDIVRAFPREHPAQKPPVVEHFDLFRPYDRDFHAIEHQLFVSDIVEKGRFFALLRVLRDEKVVCPTCGHVMPRWWIEWS